MKQPRGFRFHLPEQGDVLEVYYGSQHVATLRRPRAFFVGIIGELDENVDVQVFCDGHEDFLDFLEDVMLDVLFERRLRRSTPLPALEVVPPGKEELN